MTFVDVIKTSKFYMAGTILLLAAAYYSIIPGMVVDWYSDDNYSHGFIIPLIAGYFIYERREILKNALVDPWGPGLVVIILGLLQLTVAWLGTEYFTMRSSFIVVVAGMVLYFFGKKIFRILLLPIAYLIFMVPLPYIIYDSIAFPLKLFVTNVSVSFLKLMGFAVLREGNIIIFPETTLEVADACSGIRSLVSLLALSVAYGFYTQSSNLKRWIIILSAVPIAICTNSLRVIGTGILAHHWGGKAAEGFFHEFAGLVIFALAMLMLAGLGVLLRKVGNKN